MANGDDAVNLIFKGMLLTGIFIGGKKLFEGLGLLKTKEEQQQEQTINTTTTASTQSTAAATNQVTIKDLLPNNPALAWNRNYWQALNLDNAKAFAMKMTKDKSPAKQYKYSTGEYKKFAEDIWDSKGTIDDDDDKAIEVIRGLETQYQLSLLSNAFASYYKRDLLTYLKSFMDKDNLATLLQITNNFPEYYLFK